MTKQAVIARSARGSSRARRPTRRALRSWWVRQLSLVECRTSRRHCGRCQRRRHRGISAARRGTPQCKRLFTRLASYAGGPAPASLASSLVEGLLRISALSRTPAPDAALQSRLDDAQIIAALHHLVVDFVYQAVIRPQAVTDYLAAHSMDPSTLDADKATRVEAYLTGEIKPLAENLVGDLTISPCRREGRENREAEVPQSRRLPSCACPGVAWTKWRSASR